MFVKIGSSNHKGAVAEVRIAAAAIELGIPVSKPLAEHERYDLVFDIDGRFVRVQCKWAARRGDVMVLRFESSRRGPEGFVRTPYVDGEVDAIAAYCPDTDTCYFVPVSEVGPRMALQLRLAPPKNGQKASIHLAADYELGAVAQLGERCHGMAEVRGSSPLSSTSLDPAPDPARTTVGAHEFRNRFGWYMERAAGGEEIRVSRHGRPFVRLLAA